MKFNLKQVVTKLALLMILSNTIFPTVQTLASEVNIAKGTIVQENSTNDSEFEESTTESVKLAEEETNSDLSSNSEKASKMKTGESQNANDSPVDIDLEQVNVINEITENIQRGEKSDSGFPSDAIYFIKGIQMLNGQEFHPSVNEINDEMNRLMQDESIQIESDGHTVLARSTKASVHIEYLGTVTWGTYGHTVGHFRVNGQLAYCLQHPLGTPATGAANSGESPYDNEQMRRAFYYGYTGPESVYSDFAQGVVLTSLILSRIYFGDSSGMNESGYDALWSRVANGPSVPDPAKSLSNSNPTVYIENGVQRTSDITLNANIKNLFNFPIPSGMTFNNVTTGAITTSGTALIKGGDKFYLSASLSYTNNYSSGSLFGSLKAYTPFVTMTADQNLQNLGRAYFVDPTTSINLRANFFAREGWLNLVKKGNDTTQNIAGAQYQILQNNAVLQTVTTAADGTIKTKGLLPGNYQVKEIKAPNGYLLDKTVKTVTVRSNETTTVTFTNIAVLGQFVLFKQDAQTGTIAQGDASLVGAEFDIVNAAGTVVDKLVIAPDGSEFKATSKQLPLGKYKRVETKAPLGYNLDPTPVEMELKYETQDIPLVHTTEHVKNQVIRGKVAIQKYYDSSEFDVLPKGYNGLFDTQKNKQLIQPLEGIEFTLVSKRTGKVVETITTNANGYALTGLHPYGEYQFIEQTPDAFDDVDPIDVFIDTDGKVYEYSLLNRRFYAEVKLVKFQQDSGNSIFGKATYQIRNRQTGKLVAFETNYPFPQVITQFETSDKGEMILPMPIGEGSYQAEEVKAPFGMVLNPTPVPFVVSKTTAVDGLVTVRVGDAVQKGSVKLTKTGGVATSVTSKESLFGKIYSFIFGQQNLENVEFTLYADADIVTPDQVVHYKKGDVVKKGWTKANGTLEIGDLYLGLYVLIETKAPVGYILDETPITFALTYAGQDKEVTSTSVSAKNTFQTLNISGKKVSDDEKPLTGVVIGLFNGQDVYSGTDLILEKDQLVGLATTDKEGNWAFSGMYPEGDYYVKELKTVPDYVLSKESFPFTFQATTNEAIHSIVMTKPLVNTAQKSNLNLTKLGERAIGTTTTSSKYGEIVEFIYGYSNLAGAEFDVFAQDDTFTTDGTQQYQANQKIDHVVVGENGTIQTNVALYVGLYYLVETKTPVGFSQLTEKIPFTVEYQGQEIELSTTEVTVKNEWQTVHLTVHKNEEIISGWENNVPIYGEIPGENQIFGVFTKEAYVLNNQNGELPTVVPIGTLLGVAEVKNGTAIFELKIPEMELYSAELQSKEGYVLNETRYGVEYKAFNTETSVPISVWEDSTAVGMMEHLTRMTRTPIMNELAKRTIELSKVDDLDGKPLEGVQFDLIRMEETEGVVVGTYWTNEEGKIVVEDIPSGTYKFSETQALDWYEKNETAYEFSVTTETNGELLELTAVNQRKSLEIKTLFATTVDGLKQVNPDVDNDLTDSIEVRGGKAGHEYYVDTVYKNSATGEAVSSSEFSFISTGDAIQKLSTNLLLPKGTLKDGMSLTATHIFYEDKEKTKEIGREDDLTLKLQTVDFKTPKVGIQTQAHTGDGKTQTFTHGDIIDAYDNVDLTHEDVLDGTKRSFKAILVAVIPENGKTIERDIWESEKIDYIVNDQKFAHSVATQVDTSQYPEGTTFYFKEIGYNEAGERDTDHNFGATRFAISA